MPILPLPQALVIAGVVVLAEVLLCLTYFIYERYKGRKIKSQTKAGDTETEEIFIRESDEHVE